MSTLARYLARLFFARFLLLLGGLAGLAIILDFLANAGEVIESRGGDLLSLLHYAALRLPEIVSTVIPLTTLLAALLTLASLLRHSELVALRAAGISQFRVLLALVPVTLLVAIPQFWVDDQVVPSAIQSLRAWGVGDYGRAGGRNGIGAATWLRQGDDVVRVRAISGPAELTGVTVFRRDPQGNLLERIEATSARHDGEAWTLHGVERLAVATNQATRSDTLAWSGRLDPTLLTALSAHPRELSFLEVLRFADGAGFGNRPLYVYRTWLHHKLATPLASILMILLAVPLAQRSQRHGGIGTMLAVGLGIGFVFFVFNGLTFAMGEAGLLPPLVAAWAPTLIFASLGGAIAFHFERG